MSEQMTVLLEEAKDETTLPSRLEEIALRNNASTPRNLIKRLEILRAIGVNPNTPLKTLIMVWQRWAPETFFINPVVDLLFLENPDFLQDNLFLVSRLSKVDDIPEWFIEHGLKLNFKSVLVDFVEHSNLPEKYLEEIAKLDSLEIGIIIANRRFISDRVLKILIDSKHTSVRRIVAGNPFTPQ